MFLIALGITYAITCQNVSAVEIVSDTIEINSNTPSGPALSNSDNFGSSIANIGDLNGDGVTDIAVGAIDDDTGGSNRGAIHIMFMNSNGTVSDTIEINNNTLNDSALSNYDYFGTSITNIGDLNGDGVTDIAVGANEDDGGGSDIGAIHIMFMNSNGTVSDTIEINNNTANGPALDNDDNFGSSIANIGDLNGDGVTDIAVGAIGDDAGGSNRGAIHIMFMNSNGTVSRTIEINDNTANGPALDNDDNFGSSIANIGDLNGDGVSDIAVGAIDDDAGGIVNSGAIHIMFMNTDGSVSKTAEINDNTANGPVLYFLDYFGSSIANIGDLNGDGVTDIAVGAVNDDASGINSGAIHIMFMNSNGTVSRTIEINDNTANDPVLGDDDYFGSSITSIGDLNGDGISDIAVGASGDNAGGISRGAIHIMFIDDRAFISIIITNITSDGVTGTLKVGDTITFTLIPDSVDNGTTINATYNFVPLSWNSTNNGTTYTAIYTVSEGETDQITPLQITDVIITNSTGYTSLPFNGTDVLTAIDANSPKFTRTETISTSQIGIILDESVTNNNASSNDFTLGGVTNGSIGSVAYVSGSTIRLNITGATISDTDSITLSYNRTSGSFDEASGNSLLNFAENVTNTLDTTPPVITLNGTNPQTIESGNGYTELGATTSDGSQVTINSDEFRDTVGTYSIYYDSTDTAGNNAIQVIRTVNIIDTTPPVITLNGTNPQTIELGNGYTELGATTSDGSQVTINSDEFRDTVGTYSIYYDSTDTAGNNAIQVIRTVNIIDTTPPVITLNGTNPQTIELGNGYTELGATTSDGSQVTINSDEFRDTVGTYSIYYDSTDTAGNNAIQVIRTVNIIDNPPPVITLNGTNPQTIILGSGYTELGATTSDGSQVIIDATEFVDEIGTYSIYYDSTDTAGNNAIQVIRTVNVIVITPPTSCTPPASGDWTVRESCTLDSSVTIQRNVLVQDGSVVSIPSGVVLDIDFASFSLTVQSGSGVLIKSGGTVT